jgi:hypothetical protein
MNSGDHHLQKPYEFLFHPRVEDDNAHVEDEHPTHPLQGNSLVVYVAQRVLETFSRKSAPLQAVPKNGSHLSRFDDYFEPEILLTTKYYRYMYIQRLVNHTTNRRSCHSVSQWSIDRSV